MDSPQSVVSPLKGSTVFAEPEKQNGDQFLNNHGCLPRSFDVEQTGAGVGNEEGFLGVLEVYIDQARDIHNICIYHKQDVYAKLCLTSDPDNTMSTKIINGGGKNPVFNENLRFNIRKIDSSLKCEIWMLSRVRNYLEDQLLGFSLVPLSEVLVSEGKLEKEFSLSSTDLFHSPAGFVQLALSYHGIVPEVIAIPAQSKSMTKDEAMQDKEVPESLPSEFDKIEFPDPQIVTENDMMVSEYFGIPCTSMDSESSESLVTSDTGNNPSSEACGHVGQSLSIGTADSIQLPKHDSPPSSVSTNGSLSDSLPVSSESSDSQGASKSSNQEFVSPPIEKPKEKASEVDDAESAAFGVVVGDTIIKPLVNINIEPEQNVVQQDIVDMYLKSMQQFTESLAKMKLPMDLESETTSSGNSSSDEKLQMPKNSNSRVFYGSRAFF